MHLLEHFPLYIGATCAALQAVRKMPWLTNSWNIIEIKIASKCARLHRT